jgi:hypothetical protein
VPVLAESSLPQGFGSNLVPSSRTGGGAARHYRGGMAG